MLTVLHGGYNGVSRKGLHNYAVQIPEDAGSRWMGVSHGHLVDGLVTCLKEHYNLHPVPKTEIYAVSPNGAALVGGFGVGTKQGRVVTPLALSDKGPGSVRNSTFSIGFAHSNDRKRALTVFGGGEVFYCSNGMVTGSHVIRRKHTTGLSLIDWITEGLQPMLDGHEQTSDQLAAMVQRHIRDKDHDQKLLELGRGGILPWRLVGELDDAWGLAQTTRGEVLPWMSEEEQVEGGNTDWEFSESAWDWYNILTHTAKKIPPADQYGAMERAYDKVRELVLGSAV